MGVLLASFAEMQANMNANMATIKASMAEQKACMGAIDNRIATFSETMTALAADLKDVRGTIDEHDSRLAAHDSLFKEQDSRMKTQESHIETLGQRLQKVELRNFAPLPVTGPRFEVPHFDGSTSWTAFKLQFEMVSKGNGWTDDQTLTALTLALRGSAVQILETIPASGRSLGSLLDALDARYGDRHLEHVYRAQLRDRVQRPGEGLQQWAMDIERLVRRAYASTPDVTETQVLQIFIDGIRDIEVRAAVRLAHHQTLRAALAHALEVEAVRQAQRPYRINQVRQVSIHRGPTCYECGKRGHLQIDCPRRKPWRMAAETQVDTEDLNTVKAARLVPSGLRRSPTVIIPDIHDGNSFIVNGELNGRTCNFTIDTGASRTIVRPELLPRTISWGERQKGFRLQTATGQPVTVLGESVALLKMGDKTTTHPVIIANITSDCIIGLDFLRKHECTLDVARGVVSFPDQEIEAVNIISTDISDGLLCERKEEKSQDDNGIVKNLSDGNNGQKIRVKRRSKKNKAGQKKVEEETARRVELLVKERIDKELQKRNDEIEQEVARRVEEVKRRMKRKLVEEFGKQREQVRQGTSPEIEEYWNEFEADILRRKTNRIKKGTKDSLHRLPDPLIWKQSCSGRA